MFSDQTHMIQPFAPPQDWTIFEMGDHGRKNPTVWLWGAVDFDGNVFIFDEHYLAGHTPTTHAEAMLKIRQRYELKDVAYSVIDPSIEEEDLRLYDDRGIRPIKGNNDVLAGINAVSEHLQYDPDRTNPVTKQSGSPRLFVMANCINLIRELHEYQWKRLGNRSSVLNEPEEPRKYQDHAVDALRYGIMSFPTKPERDASAAPGSAKALMERHMTFIRAKQENTGDPIEDWQ
jgi:hypothetical protein